MIIDAHVHMGKGNYGTLDELKLAMQKAKIDKAILVAGGMLDVRKMTRYIMGQEIPNGDYIPNDIIEAIIKQEPEKFYGFYCVNPLLGDKVLEDFEKGIRNGFVGLKLAPLVHNFPLTSQTVMELANLCGELDVPLYSHVLAPPGRNTSSIIDIAKKFPRTKVIIGHMGFGPSDMDAIEATSKYDNLFMETSQGSFTCVKMALEKCGSTKLIFGSEFPLYNPKVSLANIIELNCSSRDFENITYKNIKMLLEK